MKEPFTDKRTDFLLTQPSPVEPAPLPKKTGTTFRYVLPAVLLVLVVGGIAWVTQFMPNWRAKKEVQPVAANATAGAPVIKFTLNRAVWDPSDPDYYLETEIGTENHFDFPFENNSDAPAELGLEERSCDCSNLKVCVLNPEDWVRYNKDILEKPLAAKAGDWGWQKIVERDPKGFIVPARGKGLVRVGWHGRKGPGSRLSLTIKVWHEPRGNLGERHFDSLQVPSVVAAATMFMPARINVGTIVGPRGKVDPAVFTLWSATRDQLDLTSDDAPDPLFEYDSKPFSPEECRAWETKLRKEGENTRVKCAYKFRVTVHEQAGGKTLYQGPFHHQVFLGEKKMAGPVVLGAVKAEVIVGNAKDRGKVDLETFRAKDGVTREFSLWADNQLVLEQESQTPATLEVKLTKAEKTGAQAKWLLQVTVPADTQAGPFPEESVIILRIKASPPRFVRIPVTGNGQS